MAGRGRHGAAAAFRQRQQPISAAAPASQPVRITPDAQRWIAENLLLGHPANLIISALEQSGCPRGVAEAEIRFARESPYFQGAGVLQERLKKRDWLLDSYSRLARTDGALDAIDTADRLPANRFFRDYYAMHRPVLIDGLIDHWPAMERWSLDYFDEVLGNPEIEVQTRRESNPAYESQSHGHKETMPLEDVIRLLRRDLHTNDFYVTANNGALNRTALARLWADIDGIDGYLDPTTGMDGFFWMGPKGTVTPFHHDLTNNLLVQLRGRKRVAMVSSWDTPLMRNHMHCFSSWTSPEEIAALGDDQRPTLLTCTIEPGQALFIPVGWWHHVVGLDMTIGMSFTNFTRPNDFYSSYTTYQQV